MKFSSSYSASCIAVWVMIVARQITAQTTFAVETAAERSSTVEKTCGCKVRVSENDIICSCVPLSTIEKRT